MIASLNQLERNTEMGDGGSSECLSQDFGVCSHHFLCSDALSSWLTLGASMGPTSPSSPGPVGDFHFRAVGAASPCAGGVWLKKSHVCSAILWSLSFLFIKYFWGQRITLNLSLPNPQDAVYFGAFNLQP